MKRILSNAGYYEVSIPEHWTCEKSDNILSLYEQQNNVVLQISSYLVNSAYPMNLRMELAEFVAEQLSKPADSISRDIFEDNNSVFIRRIDSDSFYEYRMMFDKQVLLLITYQCFVPGSEYHTKHITAILRTIRLHGASQPS